MSDREGSVSRSRSASSPKTVSPKRSSSRPRSISKKHSRSASKSPARRSRSRSYRHESRSRSRDRKYSRSRSRSHKRRSRSRSRSYDRRRSSKYDKYERSSRSSYQYEKERSPMSERRRHQGERVSRNGTSPLSDRRRHQGDKDNPRKSRCLGVFGLNLRTQERDLREIFERYGQIEDLQIVYDHQTGRSRGFGFVYFKYIEDAIDAKEQATGLNLDGRNIRIDYSITERAHTPTPGVYLGRTAGAGMRYGRRSPSPYRGGATHYSRSRSRSRSTSRRRY